ncbi:metallophosphoesterase family protein [Pseudomonas sp. BNK-43-a]|uniref:metallophosphoesterase family protein n=1 Tax=unclassified Pseudomonas TaxID=196821 RepID=UPI0039BF473C
MIGIISDIHGNFAALSTVLAELDRMGVDEIICLGDTAGYYSQVNECCDILRARGIFSLMGNHDAYIALNQPCPRSNSANACLDYQREVLSADNRRWLESLPERASLHGLELIHGGWNDPLDEYLEPSEAYFAEHPGRFFASGHSHVQFLWQGRDKTWCNPGSVGQPRDGDPRAAFATWDGQRFALYRIAYDIEAAQRAMAHAGFTDYFYENLAKGTQIGGRVSAIRSDLPPANSAGNRP